MERRVAQPAESGPDNAKRTVTGLWGKKGGLNNYQYYFGWGGPYSNYSIMGPKTLFLKYDSMLRDIEDILSKLS